MRKRFEIAILLLFILMNAVFLSSCSLPIGGEKMFDSRFSSDQDTANTRMDEILNAIKNKDKDALKSMFSKQAINDSENFENDISELLDFFQGDFVSYNDWDAVNTEEEVEYGDKQQILFSTYDVATTKQKYRIAIKDMTIDTTNKENVGIWSFYIIKLEDDTDPEYAYRGDGNETPGINFNIKNVIN